MRIVLVLVAVVCTSQANALAKPYPYQRCFEIAATMHNLPLDLVLAVAATESNWDADARSHANAHGIMQIQWPGTARYLGVQRVAELYNPCLNIELGARYLRELLSRFENDETTALAAYNYGPGAISRAKNIPPGALKYVATVAKHRKRINRGQLPSKLAPNDAQVLVTFTSKRRAELMSNRLANALAGATVTTRASKQGTDVVLQTGSAGLTMGDRVLLRNLGLRP